MAFTALAAIIGAEIFKCPAGSDPRIFMVAVQRAGCRIGASGLNCDLGMYGRRVLYSALPGMEGCRLCVPDSRLHYNE